MSLIALIAIFLLVGLLTGILIGMLGIGGGLVFVPALFYVLPLIDVPQENLAYFAIGSSLFAGALATSNSAILHIRRKNFSQNSAILVAAGAALSAFITPFFVVKVNSDIIKFIFASVMILVAIRMILERSNNERFKLSNPLPKPFLFFLGIFAGVLSAFTGLGGGVIYVPSLIYLFLLNSKISVGTSSIITAVTMISSAVAYSLQASGNNLYVGAVGFIIPEAAVPLGIGAIAGSFIGVKIVMKSSSEIIKKVFAILIIAAVIKIIIT